MHTALLMFLLLVGAGAPARPASAPFRLAPLFTDNMVLQQQRGVPFWGEGPPGTPVTVRASWKKESSTFVGADGTWNLTLPTPRAGGPYDIEIGHGDSTLSLRNVLVGEVWLCSGQSNMEMPLEGWPPDSILDAKEEIANSADPHIRLYTVKRGYAATPSTSCAGGWDECSPGRVHSFSAAAYFFGRTIQRALKVPLGLVVSSWGGTAVESWLSREYLSRVSAYDTVLEKIAVTAESLKILQAWLEKFPVIDMGKRERDTKWQNLGLQDEACARTGYADSAWHLMRLPTYWEKTEVGEFDGVVWFRRQVRIPASWVHRDLVLELGPVDDMDAAFVNGDRVGSHETEGFWNLDRVYNVPAKDVDSTLVTLAVRVIDNGGGGGIYGPAKSMNIHPRGEEDVVSLAGEWRYLPVAGYRGDRLYVFGPSGEQFYGRPRLGIEFSGYSPTALYNGMIAPLVPFPLAGIIWYQGESNTGAPAMYGTLLPLLIENWRAAFRNKALPFYFVQIAPYRYGPATKSAFLREAQFKTLRVKNTGMAVTMDIGNTTDIHPANKKEVGRRLALWALARNYGRNIVCSGPLYRSMKKFRDRIELSFDITGGGLVLTNDEQGNGFQIAGADRVFRTADVVVRGKTLIVARTGMKDPQAVRYAFTNESKSTFFNIEGLPSPSFRTDDWNP